MRILYLSYWSIQEGLTSASVIPHLKILAEDNRVEQVIFCSIEREGREVCPVEIDSKIRHIPLLSNRSGNVLITKSRDFYFFPKVISALCVQENITVIIARSSLAGALAYKVSQDTGRPYLVESFEPHADYMIDSGVWAWYDPRLWIQRYFEKVIKRTALWLLPVSYNYEAKLLREGISKNRIHTMPCCVALPDFKFNKVKREQVRTLLAIDAAKRVGIYVGKFGGIYYDDEALALFRKAFDFFGDELFLVILTGDDASVLYQKMKAKGINMDHVVIRKVVHHEVADYLSAADFAFSTIKSSPSRIYCSPIKNGEYWANGLPILLEQGIGDDSEILKNDGGGFILDMANPDDAFSRIKEFTGRDRETGAAEIEPIAFTHRRLELVREAYQKILRQFS